jgi:hypothetical protein
MLFSAVVIAICIQVASQQPAIAVTQSGLHVETVDCKVGDLQLATPFGRLLCVTDPVVKIREFSLSALPLLKLRESGVLSHDEWLTALSQAGLLSILLRETEQVALHFPESVVGYDLIQNWAAQTSSLPPSIKLDEQVEKLYKMYLKQDGLQRLILGTQLRDIISESSNKRSERNLSYSQIGDELKSTDDIRRRIGLQIATKQSEIIYIPQILGMTIVDSSAQVRNTAAQASAALHQHAARQYWVKLAARGSGLQRFYAANYLAHYAGPIGLKALQLVDSASGHRIGDRYSFGDIKIWVVESQDSSLMRPVLWHENSPGERSGLHLFDHLSDDTEFIYSSSTFVVTKVPSLLAEQIRALL